MSMTTAEVQAAGVRALHRDRRTAARIKVLETALATIVRWDDFPKTGRFWDREDPQRDERRPMSFRACFGSNGERDYMRGIAGTALLEGKPSGVDPAIATESKARALETAEVLKKMGTQA